MLASLTALFAMACGGYTAREAQKPSVVILKVKGKKANPLRGDIVDILQAENYPLIPRKKYDTTARKLKAKRLGTKNVRKVATRIGANAVVSGRLKKKKKRYTLMVTIRDGETGKRVDRFNVKLGKKRKLSAKKREELNDKLLAALSNITPPEPEEPEGDEVEDDEDEGEKVAEKAKKKKKKKESKKARRERERREREAEEKAEREAKREAAAERKRERAEKKKAARDKKKAAKDKKKREAEKRRAEKRKKKKKEEEELPPVELPSVGDDGQAIDDDLPPGL